MHRGEVLVSNLRPDLKNPRIPLAARPASYRDAYRRIAERDTGKFLIQARHIARYGLNAAALPIVLESEDGLAIVKDGNRRLTALRGLETPELFDGILTPKESADLRDSAALFESEGRAQTSMLVSVAESEEEARFWMRLMHRGEGGGAGLVPWDGPQGAQFDEEEGGTSRSLQVLRIMQESSSLPKDVESRLSSFPVTTLDRLLNTPEFREGIGLDVKDGQLVTRADPNAVLQALTQAVVDLSRRTKTVTDLKRKEARAGYARELLPNGPPSVTSNAARPLADAIRQATVRPKITRRKRSAEVHRKKLIPTRCKLTHPDKRTAKLFEELRRLEPARDTNTSAVMLRVALEWTVERYYKKHHLTVPKGQKGLRSHFNAVLTHLLAAGHIDKDGAQAARTEAGRPNGIMAIETIQAYVHNHKLHPRPDDLITAWDNYQPLFEAIWR